MRKKSIKIDGIQIDLQSKPLVIPEIGINHGGDLNIAKEMVCSAKRAGAKLIKHQTHIVEDEMSSLAKKIVPGNANISIYEIMKSCALTEEDEFELKEFTESLGMAYLSTPFSREAADRLERFGVKAYKVGSGEMNNYPLVKHIASFGKPMIVSTGMNNIASIKKTIEILENANVEYALMHTTNLYPTPASLVRLGAMQEMMKTFPDIPIGLSDHTVNNNAAIAAVALGAKIIERHFTDTKLRKGPDIICSMDEGELRSLIEAVNEVDEMLGGSKEAAEEEQVTINFAFSTVVTLKAMKRGELFTEENLWVKRPGIGSIKAEFYETILGKKAKIEIPADHHLSWDDVDL